MIMLVTIDLIHIYDDTKEPHSDNDTDDRCRDAPL